MFLLNTITDSYLIGKILSVYTIKCRREEIVEILKLRFAEKMQDNLPIFGIDKSNLTDFTTTEKDMKRLQSRFPPPQYRLKAEDTLVQKASGDGSSGPLSPSGTKKESDLDDTRDQLDDLQ